MHIHIHTHTYILKQLFKLKCFNYARLKLFEEYLKAFMDLPLKNVANKIGVMAWHGMAYMFVYKRGRD